MRMIPAASMFGIWSLLSSSAVAGVAGAAERVSVMGDSQMDVLVVGVLVTVGVGLAALAYRAQSTA